MSSETQGNPPSNQTDAFIESLRTQALDIWVDAGSESLCDGGQPTPEHEFHQHAFTSKLVAEALHDMLRTRLQFETQEPRGSMNDAELKESDHNGREQHSCEREGASGPQDSVFASQLLKKKDAPDDSDTNGQLALADAQMIQRILVETNFREGKVQTHLASVSEDFDETHSWRAPAVAVKLSSGDEVDGNLYGNLYGDIPPVRQRCVVDGFATDAECRDVCGFCIRGMHCMFRRGGQTSLAVGQTLERRVHASAALVSSIVDRVRLSIVKDFQLCQRELYESGSLLTRLQAKWERDMWDMSGDEEHVYWNVHIDKANVASYDYAALLYLNTQGEHFEGGDFAFVDADEDCIVSPRRGRLLTFTAGPENLHQVRRVTHGTRFVLAMWFTLSAAHRRRDV